MRTRLFESALAVGQALGGQVSLLHGGIERIQSRAQGRWFLGVATSQGPDARRVAGPCFVAGRSGAGAGA
ncbi:NIL domain-containing protein [Pseudomonas sp. GM79]|uniref:NIL domain-containing protein n=1 Tax=Pseudomonas sp. GM79 TaxID=1144338 RepID=UPI0015A59315|nr:NIL domain-containing protein [Pseudomonas sp. GM79]